MSSRSAACVLLAASLAGVAACDKLGLGTAAPSESRERPSAEQLRAIAYLPQASTTAAGVPQFEHLDRARSCRDLELAMRWNRPPDIPTGRFHKKLVYLSGGVPADLEKDSEVFFAGRIERGQSLPSGDAGWIVRLEDGSALQAVEAAETWQRQEQEEENHSSAAIVKPYIAGRRLCGHGVYQRTISVPGQPRPMPLISMLFVMDRGK